MTGVLFVPLYGDTLLKTPHFRLEAAARNREM